MTDAIVMRAGAFIAAVSDLTFNLYGYAAVLGNDFLTALYLILVKNTPAINGLTTTGLLFYNAGTRPHLLGLCLLTCRDAMYDVWEGRPCLTSSD